MKCLEKRLDVNYTRMLCAVLNKSLKQHLTKQQLYNHLPPILPTIQVRQARHAGHCWRIKDELRSNFLLRRNQCWLTCKILYSSTLCWYWVLPREMTDWMTRESRLMMISYILLILSGTCAWRILIKLMAQSQGTSSHFGNTCHLV